METLGREHFAVLTRSGHADRLLGMFQPKEVGAYPVDVLTSSLVPAGMRCRVSRTSGVRIPGLHVFR